VYVRPNHASRKNTTNAPSQLHHLRLRPRLLPRPRRVRSQLGLLLGRNLGQHRARLWDSRRRTSHFPIPYQSQTNSRTKNLALSRTYYDFFKRTLDTIASKTRSSTHTRGAPRPSNSYALHSLSKSTPSNALTASTLTHNSASSPTGTHTWDGSSYNKSSQVQIHHSGRRQSQESDEVPLHFRTMGIERKIEFSVEADSRSEGDGERDLEDGGREVKIGRGF
jgi:hypothetical protein